MTGSCRATILFVVFSALVSFSCKSDEEEGDPSCYRTWWEYYEDGVLRLSGDYAVLAPFGAGFPGLNGTFTSDEDKEGGAESCGFTSFGALELGTHNSLVCIVSTDEGPNPGWTSALDPGEEFDYRPELAVLIDNGPQIAGVMVAPAIRIESQGIDPGDIDVRTVDTQLFFVAVRSPELRGGHCGGGDFTFEGHRCNEGALRGHCERSGCRVEAAGEGSACVTQSGAHVSELPSVGIVPRSECGEIVRAIDAGCP